jgi:CMP-N,N'-diacetyllegionaminic acid synthase
MVDEAWIVIPARAGSVSIKEKNTTILYGNSLIEYCIAAAKKSKVATRIVCYTNSAEVKLISYREGLEVIERSDAWSGPKDLIADIIYRHLLPIIGTPSVIVLVQPTSPFVLPQHIDMVANAVLYSDIQSAMTMTPVPHNYHAWNQRHLIRGRTGDIDFIYRSERMKAGNKQGKPRHLVFGNVVAARSTSLKSGTFFSTPCHSFEIPRRYCMDVDTKEDIEVAEAYLRQNLVSYLGDKV